MHDHSGCREFIIYSTGYLVNQSPYKISYATIRPKENNPILIPG